MKLKKWKDLRVKILKKHRAIHTKLWLESAAVVGVFFAYLCLFFYAAGYQAYIVLGFLYVCSVAVVKHLYYRGPA